MHFWPVKHKISEVRIFIDRICAGKYKAVIETPAGFVTAPD
jgi:hypothetical protein